MSKEAEFESFLLLFADELKRGCSCERSLQMALSKYDGALSDELYGAYQELVSGKSFADVCESLARRLDSRECSIMLKVIRNVATKDARKAGACIIRFIEMLRENRELLEERKRIIKSFAFRAKALTLACTAASALLASFSPLLLTFPLLGSPIKPEISWSITLFLLLTSITASYYAARAVLAKRAYLGALFSLLTFIAIFVLSSAFIRSFFFVGP